MLRYAELHCRTNYSFLQGASHAEELAERAAELGYAAWAVTDRASLAGAVRAHVASREAGVRLVVGAEVEPADAPPLVLWAPDRAAYGRLCRLLSLGRRRAPKGQCRLTRADLAEHAEGLLAGIVPPSGIWRPSGFRAQRRAAEAVRRLFEDRTYLLAELHCGPDDQARLEQLKDLARAARIPLVAAGGVRYHSPARLPLCDLLAAVRLGATVGEAGRALQANAQRHMRPLEQIAQRFAAAPEAVARTLEVADRCRFCLDQLRYEYPEELAPPGLTPLEHLRRLTWQGARRRYPRGVPDRVRRLLEHELALIGELGYEAYFLTVWDLVRFARRRGILCQGRGSAANSAVCYCLGVTAVDPERTDVLFERFVSRERNEPPDIDVDFEHERREEVLQYLYRKYGRDRAGLAAAVITYRTRSAVRDVGKALGLSLDRVDALAKRLDGYDVDPRLPERCRQAGLDPESPLGRRLIHLANELIGFPRHLSQHVGGMVITRGPLCELAPIENAAMEGRTVVQWDKDDLEELGVLKVDCLSLGMLTAIRKTFQLIRRSTGRRLSLAAIPPEDPAVYDMICRADTMGVFQIESRAQMSMLPRLRPRCYYDLVIEVAIVRPGPIQGQMVHPYLRRRAGREPAVYPNEAVRRVLEKTLGVPIFQEQAMRLAVVAAGFTPGEADQLRRAMGAWRRPGLIDQFRAKLIEGMRRRGLSAQFAEQVFRQIRGFGEYGFPESHAASFALLVYASAWLKRYYPAAFAAALLNSQPMGFYSPAQLIRDARRHGVPVAAPDVNASCWDCTLEGRPPTLRLGLRLVAGLPRQAAEAIEAARRRGGPFRSVADLARRAGLGRAVLLRLAEADAFGGLGRHRRQALWEALQQDARPQTLPLFARQEAEPHSPPSSLPAMSPEEEVYADYHTAGLSLKGHPLQFRRAELDQWGVTPAARLGAVRHGRRVAVAGLVILRQRPSTAKGVTFVTLEDETGVVNLVVRRSVWDRYETVARCSPAWLAHGLLQRQHGVTHVVVSRLEDLGGRLGPLRAASRDFR